MEVLVQDATVTDLQVRALRYDERGWFGRDLLTERWVRRSPWAATGKPGRRLLLPALVAEQDQERVGVATYDVEPRGDVVELVTIDLLRERAGVGQARRRWHVAAAQGARTLRVMTTNDNLRALRFYQRLGFVIGEVRVGQAAAARRIKPSIPLVGHDGIPIRDEIDLEMTLPLARA